MRDEPQHLGAAGGQGTEVSPRCPVATSAPSPVVNTDGLPSLDATLSTAPSRWVTWWLPVPPLLNPNSVPSFLPRLSPTPWTASANGSPGPSVKLIFNAILTVTLARPGRTVIGIDPSATMLDYARRRAGASLVRWVHGDARTLAGERADLVVMSGNVAQHILGAAWPATLRGIHDALRPGGTLAFESRNPSARAWQHWTDERTRGSRNTEYGPLTEWLHVTDIEDGIEGSEVSFSAHTVFDSTGEHLTSTSRLAFRTREQLDADLAAAGLLTHSVAGGWTGQPFGAHSPLIVVTARRPPV
ncbi:MAG: class I SAM-dependent methyltransferase [Jatrophihabitans sp.]